jgi:hypothetical protein
VIPYFFQKLKQYISTFYVIPTQMLLGMKGNDEHPAWLNDLCALGVILLCVYSQLYYFMAEKEEKFKKMNKYAADVLSVAEQGNLELLGRFKTALDDFQSGTNTRIQGLEDDAEVVEKRHSTLNTALKEIVVTETGILKESISQVQRQLTSGGHWGKDLRALQAQLEAARKRETGWTKALKLTTCQPELP